jgi:hypothetical protein
MTKERQGDLKDMLGRTERDARCTYTPQQADGRGPLSDSRACVEMENGAFFCLQSLSSQRIAVSNFDHVESLGSEGNMLHEGIMMC